MYWSYSQYVRNIWSSTYLTFCVGFHLSQGSSPLWGSSTGGCRIEIHRSPFCKAKFTLIRHRGLEQARDRHCQLDVCPAITFRRDIQYKKARYCLKATDLLQNIQCIKNTESNCLNVGFEVLAAVAVRSTIFWYVIPFWRNILPHPSGSKNKWSKKLGKNRWQIQECREFKPLKHNINYKIQH